MRYEVAPTKNGSGWDVTRQGESVSHHRKKEAAVERATRSARKEGEAQVIIKRKDGKIQDERTYGSDPNPPRG